MGRTLRKNIKKYQAAPYLIYLIRRWKKAVEDSKAQQQSLPPTTPEMKNWADWDEDDTGLPDLPEWLSTNENPWKISPTTPDIQKTTSIKFVDEYIYKNS